MTKTRTIDNTDRPAQPEPGESEAANMPGVREEAAGTIPGGREAVEEAEAEERERQTGEKRSGALASSPRAGGGAVLDGMLSVVGCRLSASPHRESIHRGGTRYAGSLLGRIIVPTAS